MLNYIWYYNIRVLNMDSLLKMDTLDLVKSTFSEELFEKYSLLFKEQCLIVLKPLRKDMLDIIYYTHLSIENLRVKRENIYFDQKGIKK